MQIAAVLPLAAWQNFYAIIGSAAGALTGLMFVVITLVAGAQVRKSSETIATFSSPTVVHFCLTLLIAVTLSAPWQMLWNAAFMLGLIGLGGLVYVVVVARRTIRQHDYEPVLEDWLFNTIFPLVSYATLIVAAILLQNNPVPTLFAVGAATVLLLFIGIHNSWDAVTYITVKYGVPDNESQN